MKWKWSKKRIRGPLSRPYPLQGLIEAGGDQPSLSIHLPEPAPYLLPSFGVGSLWAAGQVLEHTSWLDDYWSLPGNDLAYHQNPVTLAGNPKPRGRPTMASVPHAPIPQGPGSGTGIAVGQVRGILAERVVVSTMLDPFLTLKALVAYSGIGLRRLYDLLSDPAHPLPHYRVGGKIVVRRSEFDGWMAAYRRLGRADVGAIVTGVLTDLRAGFGR